MKNDNHKRTIGSVATIFTRALHRIRLDGVGLMSISQKYLEQKQGQKTDGIKTINKKIRPIV